LSASSFKPFSFQYKPATRKPTSGVAAGGVYHYKDGRTAPDTINATLEYPDNWIGTFEATLAPGIKGAAVEICGTEGKLWIDRGRYEFLSAERGAQPVVVKAENLLVVAGKLRDSPELKFEQLLDLCGMDYSTYGSVGEDGDSASHGQRYAVVYHLLSISYNCRLRLRIFAADDDFPVVDSVIGIWPSANWYEREAFDLYGIMFSGHPDLRRLLTDYGFIGHPFRKDFPLSGNVEMRYDPDKQRVIYQPVTIEPREITPRIIREEQYGNSEGFRKG